MAKRDAESTIHGMAAAAGNYAHYLKKNFKSKLERDEWAAIHCGRLFATWGEAADAPEGWYGGWYGEGVLTLIKVSIAVAVMVLVQACAPTMPKEPTSPKESELQKAPALPENGKIDKVHWPEQNWTASERYWFHHATQGAATFSVPYKWFISLEQPILWQSGDPPMLRDPEYLSRFGFIPSPKTSEKGSGYGGGRKYGSIVNYDMQAFPGNPDGLPVGFAITRAKDTPGVTDDLIGLTCAACHTGNMEYKGTSIRIDGGSAMIDLDKFRKTLGLALIYTINDPLRFGRFADLVLGENRSEEEEVKLEKALHRGFGNILAVTKKREKYKKDSVEEGFSRLDALNRIGNQVFTTDFLDPKDLSHNEETLGFNPWDNYRATNAPVNFPHIWSTSWFNWVQYDASIMQPMVRNAGEALGVSAGINVKEPNITSNPLFASTLKVKEIHNMETLLAGDNPFVNSNGEPETKPHFKGLRAPKWPADILGKIDKTKIVKGKDLYLKHCKYCHGLPVNDPSGGFWKDEDRWSRPNKARERYYKVEIREQSDVGTDPAQGNVLATRKVKVPLFLNISPNAALCGLTPGEPSTEAGFGSALAAVVEKAATFWYEAHDTPPARREEWNGNRPNCIQAGKGYKARPLNGVWATAPFLHNGSVPNLYALLSPANERPKKFCLGHREFDPKHVGYTLVEPPCPSGTFELDTNTPGNFNAGHEFKDAPDFGDGVVGKKRLTDDETWALIEYLKTL